MKLSIILMSAFLSFTLGMIYLNKPKPKEIFIGVYDPSGEFVSDDRVSIQNLFFSWSASPSLVEDSVDAVEKAGRIPLVTLEPWQKKGDQNYLVSIVEGKYDDYIDSLCKVFAKTPTPTIVRWGHEMELTMLRYPWSGSNASDYKGAYQYFVDRCRRFSGTTHSILFMWSPSGEKGMDAYWPGGGYVDIIGLSAYSYGEWDLKNIGHLRSFMELVTPKYERVKAYNKPVILAEMATTGTETYKHDWLATGLKSLDTLPGIIALVYFDAKDAEGVWGEGYGAPDWTIEVNSLDSILDEHVTVVKSGNLNLLSQQLLSHLK